MLVDPDGRKITPQSRQRWYSNKILAGMVYQRSLSNYKANRTNRRELAASLYVLLAMDVLEFSSQMYNLTPNGASIKYDKTTVNIDINAETIGAFFHEVVHAIQFETNELGFNEYGGGEAYDINDEIEAYLLQSIMVPGSIPDELIDSDGNINVTNENVRNIKKKEGNETIYPYGDKSKVPDEKLNGDSMNGDVKYKNSSGLIFKSLDN